MNESHFCTSNNNKERESYELRRIEEKAGRKPQVAGCRTVIDRFLRMGQRRLKKKIPVQVPITMSISCWLLMLVLCLIPLYMAQRWIGESSNKHNVSRDGSKIRGETYTQSRQKILLQSESSPGLENNFDYPVLSSSPPILISKMDDVFQCRVTIASTYFSNMFGSWSEETPLCIPIDPTTGKEFDETYSIELSEELLHLHARLLSRGKLIINISPSAKPIQGQLHMADDVEIEVVPTSSGSYALQKGHHHHRRRRVVEDSSPISTGHRRILALRVSTNDAQPFYSTDEYNKYLFGSPSEGSEGSVQSQLFQCSSGKVKFVPILNGVVDVVLDKNISEFSSGREVANAALAAFKQSVPINYLPRGDIQQVADHVLICIPPGTGNWVAAAVTSHFQTIYNDRNCARLSVVMHEIGHNFGLTHANQGDEKYMDQTGYMGVSYASIGHPRKCYNAQNHWNLGWFQDRALALLYFTEPRLVHLAAFVDYGLTSETEPVLINISNRFFLQYNRAKYFNADTGESSNQVTIIENLVGSTDLLGSLDYRNPRYTVGDFFGVNNGDLVIEVCEMVFGDSTDRPDTVVLSIARDYSVCGAHFVRAQRPPHDDSPAMHPTMSPIGLTHGALLISDEYRYHPPTLPPSSILPSPTGSPSQQGMEASSEAPPETTPKHGKSLYAATGRGFFSNFHT